MLARSLILLFFFPLLSNSVLATTVYKWVDEHGRVNFSDVAPAPHLMAQTVQLRTPEPVDSALTEQRLAQMREVTDRMASDRREREKARAEARRATQVVAAVQPQYIPYPVFSGVRRIAPRPPLVRPPIHRPLPIGQPAITSQYPAKLIRRHYGSPYQRRAFLRSTGLIHRRGS